MIAAIGLVLSTYALYVRHRADNQEYKALCDFKENMSCSKAFTSKEGSLFVLPNPVIGLAYYTMYMISGFLQLREVQMLMVSAAMVVTLYLAYVLYVRQKNFCLVCTSIYVVNVMLFFSTLLLLFPSS